VITLILLLVRVAAMRQASSLAEAAAVVVITPDEWAYVVWSLGLSPQQANVVQLMLDGHQDKEIATALDLRVSTDCTYVARIFLKTRVKGRIQFDAPPASPGVRDAHVIILMSSQSCRHAGWI
jgi:DNA-binding NarL/FixJ family response regulator